MTTWPTQRDEVAAILDACYRERPGARVLEAGCGSASHVPLPSSGSVDGIDISAQQLERNQRLTRRFLGDLTTYDLPSNEYDVVVCWDVLEHLRRPDEALERLFNATAPGGLVILGMPNVRSFEAQLTKWTPHWLHVYVLRHFFGNPRAGKDDLGPFPTFLRASISLDRIQRLAGERGFTAIHTALYARDRADVLGEASRTLQRLYLTSALAAHALTLGYLEPKLSSALIVLRRLSEVTRRCLVGHSNCNGG